MKKAIQVSGLATVLLIGAIVGFVLYLHCYDQKNPHAEEAIIPTVFVHGYKGTRNSFSHMLGRLNYNDSIRQTAMQIFVSEDGHLSVHGKLNKNEKGKATIQVIFDDNRASLARQTIWLQSVMRYLREKQHIATANIVGHSMGGLASVSYLESTPASTEYPVIQKFIAIATPFNGINKANYFKLQTDPAAHDLKTGSDALQQIARAKDKIPKNIHMLAIAGDRNKSGTDGLVRVDSVFFAKKLFLNYQERLISGTDITHSGLHENERVDQLVSQFLWNSPDGAKMDSKMKLDTVPNKEK